MPPFFSVVVLCAAVSLPSSVDAQRGSTPPDKESPCHARLAAIAPKAIRDVAPRYPAIPAGTEIAQAIHHYEVLIGTDGKVSQVWTLGTTRFEPPFPKFDRAIVRAIKQWEFEPYRLNGVATPLCMSMTMNVDWN